MTTPNTNIVDLSSPLTIYNATDAALAEIKEKYQGLTIAGVDDKDGYKAVSEGLRIIVALRNKVDKRRQELKRHIDNGSKHILTALAPVETALRLQKDHVDQEIERIKQEKAEAERLKFVARTQSLFDMGFAFNGSIYTFEDIALSPTQINGLSDEEWTPTLDTMSREVNSRKAAKEALAAEANRLKEENERLRRELEAKQAVENGVTVNTTIQPAKPASSITIPVRFEDEVELQESQEAPSLPDDPGFDPMLVLAYDRGFNSCRERVLQILLNPAPTTRKALIEQIQTLNP